MGVLAGESSIVGIDVTKDGNAESCSSCGWLFEKCVERKSKIVGMCSGCFICNIASFHV